MSGGIVAVTSLALEARIARGAGVSVICSQGSRLAAALESAIESGASGIISFGVAGGLAPDLVAGDWIAATAVKTGQQLFPTDQAWRRSLIERLPEAMQAEIFGMDSPVADPRGKRLLHAQTGAAAVDMESHIAARIAAAYQIPFVACRAIIDPADKPLPPAALVGLRPDGTADVVAVLRSVLQRPSQVPALVRTALDARIARAALRRGCRMLGAGLGFPDFQSTAPHQDIAATEPACACAGERGRTDRAPFMESATTY
jgi:adenosylhomocysteine nucleosidase